MALDINGMIKVTRRQITVIFLKEKSSVFYNITNKHMVSIFNQKAFELPCGHLYTRKQEIITDY